MRIIILAGGSGSRLWPLSKQDFPKQFLKLGSAYSLLQETVRRFLDTYPLFIVTNHLYEPFVKEQLKQIQAEHVPILAEPTRRNTAPAIALALRFLEEFDGISPDEPLLMLPSDHLLAPRELFFAYLAKVEAAISRGKLVLFGIQPTRSETAFGYMKIGKTYDEFCYNVDQFVEKPDGKRAELFIQNPLYYWNSGMLAFSGRSLWQELEQHLPKVAELRQWSWADCLDRFYLLPDISIDYGIIEKTHSVVSCPLPIKWSDLGSWDLVYESLEKDRERNVTIGKVANLDTKRCLFIASEKKIAAIGLEDLVVVDTKDVLFISKKKEAHRLKELLQMFELL